MVAELGRTAPWFLVSAATRDNTMPVCQQVQRFFESQREENRERTDMLPNDVRLRGEPPQD